MASFIVGRDRQLSGDHSPASIPDTLSVFSIIAIFQQHWTSRFKREEVCYVPCKGLAWLGALDLGTSLLSIL